MKEKMKWDKIDKYTAIMRVPGGWVLRCDFGGYDVSAVFIKDPNWEWNINKKEEK